MGIRYSGKTGLAGLSNGIVIGHAHDIRNYGAFIIINGKKIGSLTGDVTQRSFFYFNVSEGDRITIDADDVHATFVPYYGS